MKKKVGKLNLHRETLHSLDLAKANGGTIIAPVEGDTHFDHTCGTVCDIPSWHCTRCSIC